MTITQIKAKFPEAKETFELLQEIMWLTDSGISLDDSEFVSATEALQAGLKLVRYELSKISTAS